MAKRRWRRLAAFLWSSTLVYASDATSKHFIGAEACALCHKAIAAEQERSAMAHTWQGHFATSLPASFRAGVAQDLPYELTRSAEGLTYAVKGAAGRTLSLPIDIAVGGMRHGVGLLVSLREIDGLALSRPALIQARYAWSPEKEKLLLAPGCAAAKPQTLEGALGLVLSPTFEKRCLECHGQPNLAGSGKDGGVHCESCHGAGSEHLKAIGRGEARAGITNPRRLSSEESIGVCARCHIGLTRFSDPSADDLLVANQVRAIESSECFVQSGKAFSCTACHDPHGDAANDGQRAVKACLGCHASGMKRQAAICPVNARNGCIGCHMPSVEMGPLHLVDHLIRVHPEQKVGGLQHEATLRTEVRPVAEYLRLIRTASEDAATAALLRIGGGEPFYQVARETSRDRSAAIGGYVGRKTLTELSGALAETAARLECGERSKVVRDGGQWVILERLGRDFRWDAEQLQREAENLGARGDAVHAIEKAQAGLMVYPQSLRALTFIGMTFAQNGNPQKGAAVLRTAAGLYPEDAGTQFALASTLELLNDSEAAGVAYKRAIALEPDFTAVYSHLGMIYYSANDWQTAIKTFRLGLQVDPLSAELNYDLGLALGRSGDGKGAEQAMALAHKLDPALVGKQ